MDDSQAPAAPVCVDGLLLERLLRSEGHRFVAYARALTGHAQDAEDALQEALARVAFRRVASADHVRAYLYKAVRNAALNRVRWWRRLRQHEEVTPDPRVSWVVEAEPAREEEVEALNAALAALPPEQREVVTMKVWSGLSFTEIAEVVGIPRDTAASRYRYALAALRAHLRRPPEEIGEEASR